MPQVQHYGASTANVMIFFITLLCASQVYASCTSMDSTDCTSSPTSTIIGIAIGGTVILLIMICVIRIRRRQRLQQRTTQTTLVYATPSNSYGRRQSNVYHPYPTQSRCPPGLQSSRPVPGQMNSLNRQGMTVAPSFPQPSHPSPMTHSAHTRSPTSPSPTHYSYSNQTPRTSPSSQNSTRLPPGFPLSPSSPSTYSRISADPSTVQTPSTPAAYTPHATPVGRPSPPENMEMRPLSVNAGVENDEPPPAYTV
ncbi:hypothetical protein DFJ58DRAFT_811892 [Suillus subalutaceus]|uniref:uncharacterized protein n=1 Tax=Suillus subalutaceus TaxID=48586 RepID=UPI001B878338|nr:uncharacterized protein DFJ58DRAFT_811892 [Suillus subalutaceus]KAG1839653.1 hypothetical protein DFJ58DRAFT_811892 [Suillus subalutaceus]